jgi:hypothetical protein
MSIYDKDHDVLNLSCQLFQLEVTKKLVEDHKRLAVQAFPVFGQPGARLQIWKRSSKPSAKTS